MENENIICGYPAIIDWDKTDREYVSALIEVKVMPQRDDGFDKIADELKDMNLSISKSSKRNIEFMPTGMDKGNAVRILCEKTGVDPANVMAFGDQTNDLPMLSASGWPVAMENGEDSVKAAAKLIAPDHNLGGVGLILQKYVLGDERA